MTQPVPSFDTEIPASCRPDVCIVGAGIAGLSVALALVQDGLDVLVVDQGPIGGGQTARTSAHLASALDDRFYRLERRFGLTGARLAAESHMAAIDAIEANVRAFEIACDFRRVDGYLFVPPGESRHVLDRERAAARRAGLVVDDVAGAPLPFETGPCLRFANQAQFHPLAYLRGIADAVIAGGGRIHTGVHVTQIIDRTPCKLELADGRRLRATVVVDATSSSISSRLDLPSREAAYRSYVVAFDVPAGEVPHALSWDTGEPYHYIRVAPGELGRELLLVGGEDHRVGHGDPAAHLRRLEAWARARFAMAGDAVARWSGQVIEPADGLAYIGVAPGHDWVFVVTGDSGHGLTHGTIAGLLLPSQIQNRPHPWAKLYAPDRTRLNGLANMTREAARSSAPYADWLRAGDVESVDDIAPGHGATIRRGVHLLAAYRDPAGGCHVRSARCTHLSGVVRWNDVEQTWDCPCHGSRFDAYGRVLNGPAPEDLGEPPGDVESPEPVIVADDDALRLV